MFLPRTFRWKLFRTLSSNRFRSPQLAGKRDPLVEDEVLQWCGAIIGEPIPSGAYEDVLKDGVILAKVINKLIPGCIPKINTSGGNFKFMENINAVQKGMKKFGVPPEDLFQTVDLFEKRNIPAVTSSIMALGRTCMQTNFLIEFLIV